jgi:uncharacterized protein
MFSRSMTSVLKRYAQFPVIALLGPRQSGKTTLVKASFPQHTFLTFDKDTTRSFAEDEPERFLKFYENEHGIIIDEFQYVPRLISYIKMEVDEKKRPGYFVLTGSQNFLMSQTISESLAGRVGLLTLLPLSLHELKQSNLIGETLDLVLLQGGYPRIFDEHIPPQDYYPSYIQSYIERDVRQLINVGNLRLFHTFLQLCAGRVGQVLNISGLAQSAGISFPTAASWLSILEASYVIFLVQPSVKTFNKRVTKTPKLYFVDQGLACSLLQLTTQEALAFSPFRGALFENLIVADLYKQFLNLGERPPLYFWRDRGGVNEIDCIINEGLGSIPVEIKASSSIRSEFFKGIRFWNQVAHVDCADSYVVYGGTESQDRSAGNIVSWLDAADLVSRIRRSRTLKQGSSE